MRLGTKLAKDENVEINGAVLIGRGSEHLGDWMLQTNGTILQGEFVSSEKPLCDLLNATLGDQLEAEISVRPVDGSLICAEGDEMPSAIKKAIIQQLSIKKLQRSTDTHGWISLGVHKLSVVRGDRM